MFVYGHFCAQHNRRGKKKHRHTTRKSSRPKTSTRHILFFHAKNKAGRGRVCGKNPTFSFGEVATLNFVEGFSRIENVKSAHKPGTQTSLRRGLLRGHTHEHLAFPFAQSPILIYTRSLSEGLEVTDFGCRRIDWRGPLLSRTCFCPSKRVSISHFSAFWVLYRGKCIQSESSTAIEVSDCVFDECCTTRRTCASELQHAR